MTKYSYITREIEGEFSQHLLSQASHRDVILVEGARQVGKTATVRHLLQNRPHIWIDFQRDKSLVRQIDQTSSFDEFADLLAVEVNFQPSQGSILVIDEAQESERLGGYVRYMKEIWSNQTTLLLGSAMHRLFRKGIKYPVGRVHRITVHPFSFIEFLRALDETYLHDKILHWTVADPLNNTLHKRAIDYLNIYLRVGGLPAIVLDYKKKADWQDRLMELSFDYVEDYKRIHGEERSNLFELILRRISETLGSPSKLTTIMASNQPGYRHLPDLMNLIENWGLVDKIGLETPRVANNHKIPPKRYLFDHGIRQRFSPMTDSLKTLLSQEFAHQSPLIGGIMENFVINELRSLGYRDITSWREQPNGSEVDFVVRTSDYLIPIEVKSSLKTSRKFFSVLERFHSHHSMTERLFLINGDCGRLNKENGALFYQIPFYAMSLLKKDLNPNLDI